MGRERLNFTAFLIVQFLYSFSNCTIFIQIITSYFIAVQFLYNTPSETLINKGQKKVLQLLITSLNVLSSQSKRLRQKLLYKYTAKPKEATHGK
jgi:hypothetical protein